MKSGRKHIGQKPKRAYFFQRKNSCTFSIHYHDGDRINFTSRCSPQTAVEIVAKINDRIARGTFDLKDFAYVKPISVTLLDFLSAYITARERANQLGQLSRAAMEKDIQSCKLFTKILGPHISIDSITAETIDNFRLQLLSTKTKSGSYYSPSSINSYLKSISAAFNWAIRERSWLSQNPCRNLSILPENVKKRIHTIDEIDLIRSTLACSPTRWKLDVYNLALWIGARRAEIHGMKANNLFYKNFVGQDPVPFMELSGKGNQMRVIALGPKAHALIKERIAILQDAFQQKYIIRKGLFKPEHLSRIVDRFNQGYLFWEILHEAAISHAFNKLFRSLNLPYTKFHDARKSFGTYALEDGVTLEYVQANYGHSNKSTTEKFYTEITLRKLYLERNLHSEK